VEVSERRSDKQSATSNPTPTIVFCIQKYQELTLL
jgi:hypothetical protein